MATTNEVPAVVSGNQVVGKVVILYGTVKAISPDGTVRLLMPNSPIFANDHIVTESDGSVSIMFDGTTPTQMDLGRMSNVVIDEDVYAGVAPSIASDAAAEAEQIQQALMASDQPIDLEATAAGGVASAGGGHPLFVVNVTGAEVTPTSGAETIGVTYGAPGTLEGVFAQPAATIAPIANPDSATVVEGGHLTVDAAHGVLANDIAGSGVISVVAGTFTGDHGGTLVLASDGSYTYTAPAHVNNPDGAPVPETFIHTVTDSNGFTSNSTLIINITDTKPIAVNDNGGIVTEDAPVHSLSGDVLTNDTPSADTPMSFSAWSVADAAAAHAALDQYGTLSLNSDGTWSFVLNNSLAAVQHLTASDSISQTINYTMHDADGSPSSAALIITIHGADDNAHVSVSIDGPDSTVYEAGLSPYGTHAGDGSASASHSFDVSATDGIDSVVVGGHSFTLAQLQGFTSSAPSASIITSDGSLVITGYSGDAHTGTVSYTYTLGGAVATDSAGDSVVVTVNGIGGTHDTANLTIAIVDDTPQAVNDGPFTVTEDAPVHSLSGNVLSNDASGADHPASFSAWSATDAAAAHAALDQYGTLALNSDGSWSFDLNNSLASVQALTAKSQITQTINYTIQDVDGSPSNATMTIVINGADDSAHVSVDASGTDITVYEHGLTSVADTSETSGNSFSVEASDGISTVVVGSQSFNLAELQGFTPGSPSAGIDTGEGTMYITGYTGSATSGVVSYTYTLNAALTHPLPGNDVLPDSVGVTVNGIGGTTASANLAITIVDDTPVAHTDGPYSVTEDGATHLINGNVLSNDVSGADTPMSFSAWSVADAAAAHAALDQYGTLALNSDGSWSFDLNNSLAAVQHLTASDSINQTINYTMHDADGDTSSAALTITIHGADDSAHVSVDATGTDITVYEHGLTSVANTSETSGNSFSVEASDGISTVVVGSQSFNLAELQGFTPGSPSAGIDTGEGTMYITGYTGSATSGVVSYTYTLNAALTHPLPGNDVLPDSVGVTVNGIGGTTASANLAITIVDDTPVAHTDGPYSVTEDGATHLINGNVLSNDVSGADTPMSFSAWSVADAAAAHAALDQYGTLALNSDGSWSFDLNNSLAAVQHLTASDSINQTINYTMHDADGDTSSAALTITIHGADDSAHVSVDATGTDITVYEHGLTSVANTSETSGNSFSVEASDGISSVVVGSQSFDLAELQGFTPGSPSAGIDTGEGTMYITGYTGSATSGVVSYTYTLNAALTHPLPGNDVLPDSVDVTVNGIGGTHDTASLHISIIDDVPTFTQIDSAVVANESSTGTGILVGTHDIVFGADGEQTIDMVALTHLPGLNYSDVVHNLDGSTTITAGTSLLDPTITTGFFELTIKPDGTYDFNLLDARPTITSDPITFVDATGGKAVTEFTLGDATFSAVDSNHDGTINLSDEGVKGTSVGLGIGNGNADPGDQFAVTFANDILGHPIAVDVLTFYGKVEGSGSFTVSWDTDTGEHGTSTLASNGVLSIDPLNDFHSIVFTVDDGKAKVDSFAYSERLLPGDETLQFNVSAVDSDGDHTGSQTLNVTLLGIHPEAGFTITGSTGPDALIGTSGNDILQGSTGADIFTATHGHDHITDYNKVVDGDVVDISNLVASATRANLSVTDDAGKAQLHVYADAGHTTEVGSITFDNISSADAPNLDTLLGAVDVKDGSHNIT